MSVRRWLPWVSPAAEQAPALRQFRRVRTVRYPAAALAVLFTAGGAQALPPPPDRAPVPAAQPEHGVWTIPASPFTAVAAQAAALPQVPAAQARMPGDAPALPTRDRDDLGIPKTVLDAYRRAELTTSEYAPGCRLSWVMLAAIGKVESGHADDGDVQPSGDLLHPIFGPTLNGTNNVAAIPSPNGNWARAEGPMQMLPSTWGKWSADGNADGRRDPQNVYDATLSASRYLCASGRDLSTPQGQRQAILSYNPSGSYYQLVSDWMRAYQGGSSVLPDMPGAFDLHSRAHGGQASPPTETPQEAAPQPPFKGDHPTPQPAPKPEPGQKPEPAPKTSPAPVPPRLLPPPVNHLLPAPLGASAPPLQPTSVDGITKTVDQLIHNPKPSSEE